MVQREKSSNPLIKLMIDLVINGGVIPDLICSHSIELDIIPIFPDILCNHQDPSNQQDGPLSRVDPEGYRWEQVQVIVLGPERQP